MLVPGRRLAVFSIRDLRKDGKEGPVIWVRAGHAFVNRDGSMNVTLDVLPIDGKLHVREAGEKRDNAPATAQQGAAPIAGAAAGMGGH